MSLLSWSDFWGSLQNAETFLQDFKGYHQADAYSGYNVVHNRKEITWVACWAHARRKYIEITKTIKEPGIVNVNENCTTCANENCTTYK